MMLSFIYFGSIISQVINPNDFEIEEKKDDKVNSTTSKSKSFEKSLARFKTTLRSNRSLNGKPRANYGARRSIIYDSVSKMFAHIYATPLTVPFVIFQFIDIQNTV